MTNTFLSLYRLFFIDENEKIWAVFKDGRVCFVKNGFAFCAFSSDRKGILGVSFRQNETAVWRWICVFLKENHTRCFMCKDMCIIRHF